MSNLPSTFRIAVGTRTASLQDTMHMRAFLARAIAPALVALLFAPGAAAAQQPLPDPVQDWLENCRDQRESRSWGDRRTRHCEVRQTAVARGTRALDIDGRQNGGVRIVGWDRDSIAVFAMVQTEAPDAADARAMAGDLRVVTSGGRIRTEGDPDGVRRSGWSVSYYVFTPRRMDIEARTHNGGVAVDGVTGDIDVEAHNGGLAMRRVGGDVRGRTQNGGISLSLSGSRWEGRGVDLQTVNGGVRIEMPERYNARLETATVNGGFDIDIPITLQGRIGRSITTTLGEGGPLVRATTTNGGVRISRS